MNKIQKIIKENNLIIPKKKVTERYDRDGNLIWKKFPNGNIWESRYKDGNLIWECQYKDKQLVWQKYPGGTEYWFEDDDILKLEDGEYYLNGELLEKQKK